MLETVVPTALNNGWYSIRSCGWHSVCGVQMTAPRAQRKLAKRDALVEAKTGAQINASAFIFPLNCATQLHVTRDPTSAVARHFPPFDSSHRAWFRARFRASRTRRVSWTSIWPCPLSPHTSRSSGSWRAIHVFFPPPGRIVVAVSGGKG